MPSCDSKRFNKRSERGEKNRKKERQREEKRNYLSLARLGPHLLDGGRSHGNTHTQVNQLDVYICIEQKKGVCWKCTVKKKVRARKTMRSRSRSRSAIASWPGSLGSRWLLRAWHCKNLSRSPIFSSVPFLRPFFLCRPRLPYHLSVAFRKLEDCLVLFFFFVSFSFLSLSQRRRSCSRVAKKGE